MPDRPGTTYVIGEDQHHILTLIFPNQGDPLSHRRATVTPSPSPGRRRVLEPVVLLSIGRT